MLNPSELVREIRELLESDDIFKGIEFSKFVQIRLGEVSLKVPTDIVEPPYTAACGLIESGVYVPPFFANFAVRGLSGIQAAIKEFTGQDYPKVNITPHSANSLRELLSRLALMHLLPEWWPSAFLLDAPEDAKSRFVAYWQWNTVDPEYVMYSQLGPLKSAIVEFQAIQVEERRKTNDQLRRALSTSAAKPAEGSNRILSRNLHLVAAQKGLSEEPEPIPATLVKPQPPVPEPAVAEVPKPAMTTTADLDPHFGEFEFQALLIKQLDPVVQLSLFAARRYINKVQNALERGIEFSLTVEDFVAMMRVRTCHFSGAPLTIELTKDEIASRKLPKNYLTFDRLNPDLGYTRSNTVVAALHVNQAKARLSEAEFRQMTAAMQLIQNMTPAQREAMQSLGGFM